MRTGRRSPLTVARPCRLRRRCADRRPASSTLPAVPFTSLVTTRLLFTRETPVTFGRAVTLNIAVVAAYVLAATIGFQLAFVAEQIN